jgi:DNA-directed RNA polymerase sigma subunit (sigma70/sigma32)
MTRSGAVASLTKPRARRETLRFSYLRDIKSIPLLNREEEITLAQRIKEGETQIADEALSSMLALRWTLDWVKELPPGCECAGCRPRT